MWRISEPTSTKSFQNYFMLNVLEITLMKLLKFIACKRFQKQLIARFGISFYMKYFRDNSAENFVKLSLCEQFQKYFCCNISYNILQNFFRIISHKIWKVEIIMKPSWKFSATIGAVWEVYLLNSSIVNVRTVCLSHSIFFPYCRLCNPIIIVFRHRVIKHCLIYLLTSSRQHLLSYWYVHLYFM